MTVKIVPLTQRHIIEIYPRIRGDVEGFSFDEFVHHMSYHLNYRFSYAAEADGFTIAIGGIVDTGAGLGQVWMVGTDDIPKHKILFTRFIKTTMKYVLDNTNIHRLQADVLISRPSWVSWAKLMGLKEEGVLRQFTRNKQDCVILSYIKGVD